MEKLRKMKPLNDKLDGILIKSNDPNFFYFTGVEMEWGYFFYDFSKPIIITNSMESNTGKKNIKIIREKNDFEKIIKGKKLGMNFSKLSVNQWKDFRKISKTFDISKDLEIARMIKTNEEIKLIKKACTISKEIFNNTKFSGREEEVKRRIEILMQKHNVKESFPTIVASGSNVKIPHHIAGAKIVGNHFLVDWGVKYKGYCSDITRSFGSPHQKNMEKILDELYRMAVPGINASELDKFVRQRLGKNSKYFTTSLGHGIGIEIHEGPSIHSKSNDILEEGMVFTIEPGIYTADGLRIENDFVMGKKGLINLTNF